MMVCHLLSIAHAEDVVNPWHCLVDPFYTFCHGVLRVVPFNLYSYRVCSRSTDSHSNKRTLQRRHAVSRVVPFLTVIAEQNDQMRRAKLSDTVGFLFAVSSVPHPRALSLWVALSTCAWLHRGGPSALCTRARSCLPLDWILYSSSPTLSGV